MFGFFLSCNSFLPEKFSLVISQYFFPGMLVYAVKSGLE